MGRFRRHAIVAVSSLIVLGGLVLLPSSPAGAATVACGEVITQNTTLTADVGPCPGRGIGIGADGIFLNLNGHSVLGNFDQGANGLQRGGIDLMNRFGVTVFGGRVAGFEVGIYIDGGGRHLVQNVVVEDNVGPQDLFSAFFGDGMAIFESGNNRIIGNTVRRNGRFDGIAVLGPGANNNLLEGNVVEGNLGSGTDSPVGSGFGILFNSYLEFPSPTPDASLIGNRIRNNLVQGNDTSGITSINNIQGLIEGNQVTRNGRGPTAKASGYGSGIDVEHRPTATTRASLLIQNNRAYLNGVDGIHVGVNSFDNRIYNNDSRGNGNFVRPGFGWDLHDANPGCTGDGFPNLWRANAFFTVFQGCEAGTTSRSSASAAGAARESGTAPPIVGRRRP